MMNNNRLKTPYAIACPAKEQVGGSILYPASSVPGSRTLKYIPCEPDMHKYAIKGDCIKCFKIPLVWKGSSRVTEQYHQVEYKLRALPLLKGSVVAYMAAGNGYFFDLNLMGGIRLTISQYEDEFDQGAYVNVLLDGEVVLQDFMTIDGIVEAMLDYYGGAK